MRTSSINKIYFLHIPKTSGTSVYKQIDRYFHKDRIFPYLTWFEINREKNSKEIIERLYSSFDYFIRGHFAYNKRILKDRFVFSFFRDPTYRTISQLQHIKKWPVLNAWVNDTFVVKEPLVSTLEDPKLANILSNMQSKYLLTDFDPTDDILQDPLGYFFAHNKKFLEFSKGLSILRYIKIIFRLFKLDFIGIKEFHTESMIMLTSKLGLEVPREMFNEMRSDIKSEDFKLTPYESDLIESINTYDNFLYYFARRLFIKRWLVFLKKTLNMDISYFDYVKDREKILKRVLEDK